MPIALDAGRRRSPLANLDSYSETLPLRFAKRRTMHVSKLIPTVVTIDLYWKTVNVVKERAFH